jgi:DNA-binding transcriptional LysR family regulator
LSQALAQIQYRVLNSRSRNEIDPVDFRQTRYFLAVAEHSNFRRAAEAANVAQSALSKHIAELEARLGVQLFDRLPSGVRLTQAGRVYAEEARRSLDLMERAATRARKAARGEIDRLTIAMNDLGTRNRNVAGAVARFVAAYPEVQLDFVSMVSIEQLSALRYGKIDAGILIERPQDEWLDFVPLARDPFWIALPHDHPLADLDIVPIAALRGEAFVSVAMSTYWLPQTRLIARCRALGLVPRVVQEASNDHMQMSFVAAGMGVGFVNASMAPRVMADVVLRPVAGLDVMLELDMVWPKASASPSLLNFAAAMRAAAA